MRFDPWMNVFERDGRLHEGLSMWYDDALDSAFSRSREARDRDDLAFSGVSAFLHCLHSHHRVRLPNLRGPELRTLLLETFPRQIGLDAPIGSALVVTLGVLYRWLGRVHRLRHANECIEVLREPELAARIDAACDAASLEEERTPTMHLWTIDENAPLDDEDDLLLGLERDPAE